MTEYVAPSVALSEDAVAGLRRYLDGQGRIRAAYHVGRRRGPVDDLVLFELDGPQPVGSRRAALSIGVGMDLRVETDIPRFSFTSPGELEEARPVAATVWERGAVAGNDKLDFEFRWSPYPVDDALKASLAGVAESFEGVSAVYFAEEALVNNGHVVWTRSHLYVVCTDGDTVVGADLRESLRAVLGEQRPAISIVGALIDDAIATDSTVVFGRP